MEWRGNPSDRSRAGTRAMVFSKDYCALMAVVRTLESNIPEWPVRIFQKPPACPARKSTEADRAVSSTLVETHGIREILPLRVVARGGMRHASESLGRW